MAIIPHVTSDDVPTSRNDSSTQPSEGVLLAGQRVFSRYVLEAEAGRGGMGVVWRAKDGEIGETVALKFLPGVVARDAVAVDKLKDETRRARKLTHSMVLPPAGLLLRNHTLPTRIMATNELSLKERDLISKSGLAGWKQLILLRLCYAANLRNLLNGLNRRG